MKNTDLPLHIGKVLDKSSLVLGILMFSVGIGKTFLKAPLISIRDIAMCVIGIIIIMLISKFKLFTRLLASPGSYRKINYIFLAAGCLICTTIISAKLLFGQTQSYTRSLDENSLVEWLSFLLLIISSYIFFRLAIDKEKRIEKQVSFATSSALFIVSMEELSWGQMVFNWKTPEVFANMNSQGETTIHNIYGINTIIDPLLLCALSTGILLCLFGGKIKNSLNNKESYIINLFLPSKSILPVLSTSWIIIASIVLYPESGLFQSGEIEWAEFLISLATAMHSIQLTIRNTAK